MEWTAAHAIFDALAFSQFLQANRHSVLELNGISIDCSIGRQLPESYRFGCTSRRENSRSNPWASIPIITATNRVSGSVAERLTGKSWHTSFMSKDKQKREKKKPKKGKLSSK